MIIEPPSDPEVEIVVNATVPICYYSGKRTDVIATGILFGTEKGFYLITATHVLNNAAYPRTKLFLLNRENRKYPLSGFINSIMVKAGKVPGSDEDKGDLSALWLKGLNSADFANITITKANCFEGNISSEIGLLIAGYPYGITVNPIQRQVSARVYLYGPRLMQNSKLYSKLCLSVDTHILVEYRRRDIDNDKKVLTLTPHPEGTSGGGLWAKSLEEDGQISYRLIGILIEYHSIYSAIVALKINLITRFLEALDAKRENANGV